MNKKIAYYPEGTCSQMIEIELEGTTCGFKDTSCPDQLSKALREAIG